MRLMTITDNVDNRVITVEKLTGTSGRELFVVKENGTVIDRSTDPLDAREAAIQKAALL